MPAVSAALNMALEKALNLAQTGNGFVSYQTLAKQIDSNNLFGVNAAEIKWEVGLYQGMEGKSYSYYPNGSSQKELSLGDLL
jgi:hypothetical protein